MITADRLALLTDMRAYMLEQTLPAKDRPQLRNARFLGITNGYEFCYSVTYTEHDAEQAGKVFLRYDPAVDQVFGTMG